MTTTHPSTHRSTALELTFILGSGQQLSQSSVERFSVPDPINLTFVPFGIRAGQVHAFDLAQWTTHASSTRI